MNFADFENSTFFKKGKATISSSTGNILLSEKPIASYDASLFYNTNFLSILKDNNKHYHNAIKPHLCYLLQNNIDLDIKTMILNQWIETNDLVREINQIPRVVQLVIQGPEGYIPLHKHIDGCKQTLTFVYNYGVSNTSNDYIKLHCNDITHTFNLPNWSKFFFSIKNNVMHESNSSQWRFYWVYDFSDYVNTDHINNFTYFNLDTAFIK